MCTCVLRYYSAVLTCCVCYEESSNLKKVFEGTIFLRDRFHLTINSPNAIIMADGSDVNAPEENPRDTSSSQDRIAGLRGKCVNALLGKTCKESFRTMGSCQVYSWTSEQVFP